MSRFTPGPWLVSRCELNFGRVICPAAHADRPFGGSVDKARSRERYMAAIAHVPSGDHHIDAPEGVANARLIAAAPEMFNLLNAVKEYGVPRFNREIDALLARINGDGQ